MDGDEAPLIEIVQLAEKYSAALIVDEAHAIGIFGNSGRGLIEKYNLQNNVLARVITFGKALGCHGAAILCKKNLHSYLINFARSFIYTTAASFYTHQSIKSAYKQLSETDHKQIHSKIRLFKNEIKEINSNFIQSNSPIQCLTIGGNLKAKEFAGNLFDKGFNVRAILHPTVPVGQERLRICLHTFNTDLEIKNLIKAIKNIL
jgi:8-amino-7-oxononanoate synthase